MIYFVADVETSRIKIGYSAAPLARLSQMQSGSSTELRLLGVIPGEIEREAELHRTFAHLRIRGEWFTDDGEIRQTMKAEGAAPLVRKSDDPNALRPKHLATVLGISQAQASRVLAGKSFPPPENTAVAWTERGWKIGVLADATDADCDAFARIYLRKAPVAEAA